MPVAIGNELKLENNKVNAEYGELFRKLNVAKAWTNTVVTESGGTATVLNKNQILDNISSGYTNFYAPTWSSIVVINGSLCRIYNNTILVYENTMNWLYCSRHFYLEGADCTYAIDDANDLYFFEGLTFNGTYSSKTKITTDINWTFITTEYGIANGRLYKMSSGTIATRVGTEDGWSKITQAYGKYYGICNGVVYDIDNISVTPLSGSNDFVDVFGFADNNEYAINSSGELYYIRNGILIKSEFDGAVKQGYAGASSGISDVSIVTTDGNLYYGRYDTWHQLCPGLNWTYTSTSRQCSEIIAIGNGKLYKITPNTSGGEMTQIGTSTGYKKLLGENNGTSDGDNVGLLAWTGNATHTETTVYTTSKPVVNDKVYSDTNLTEAGVLSATTGSSITCNSKVFDIDIAKNSSFTKIPPASIHETVSVADILRATE